MSAYSGRPAWRRYTWPGRGGDDAAIHFLVPAYLDKILFNLTQMPSEQAELLARVEEFVDAAYEKLKRYGGVFTTVGVAPLSTERPLGSPFAEIEAEVSFIEEAGRAGAVTNFRPLEAANERVAELGLWALWDWSVAAGSADDAAVEFLLDVLSVQCAHYRTNGMPTLLALGIAPFFALTRRLSEEMGTADGTQSTPADANTRRSTDANRKQEAITPASYSPEVAEGIRLAARHGVDLIELANSVIAQVSVAHAESGTGRVWFPAEAIRALCCMEFLAASELRDSRLDDAFMRSAVSPSEEATSRVAAIGMEVMEERGLMPIVDAMFELIRDQSAPPASELM